LFEYSATYHGISDKHVEEYAEQIVYDYNYYRFYKDGYGKDYSIHRVGADDIASGAEAWENFQAAFETLADKLAVHEQLRLTDGRGLSFTAAFADKPLIAFMGNTVEDKKDEGKETRGGGVDEVSDIRKLLAFLAKLPAAELVLDKGYDVLLLTEDVDEFCLQIMRSYPRKDAEGKDGTVEFKNVNSGDLGLETEDEKKAAEDATAENKPLFDAMKDALDGKVKEVKVSTRLKDHPVCLSADGPLSIEMEKVLSKQPGSEGVKSDKVLELNVNHPVFAVLKAAQEAGDTDKLKKYSALLYAQAQLIEGLPVDDPAAYAEAVCSLMK